MGGQRNIVGRIQCKIFSIFSNVLWWNDVIMVFIFYAFFHVSLLFLMTVHGPL